MPVSTVCSHIGRLKWTPYHTGTGWQIWPHPWERCMRTLLGTSHFYWSANACPRSGDGRSLGCLRVHRHSQAWLVAMRFLSCLTTVSMSFCLSRSFLRSCKNILFLRLVSFIFSSRASAVCGFTLRYLQVGLP